MNRLTDRKTAADLKHNAEALRKAGFEPSIGDLQYIKLAEYEDAEERQEQQKRKKCKCWSKGSWVRGYDTCRGTREQEPCACKGDRTKCDFYPEIRKKEK